MPKPATYPTLYEDLKSLSVSFLKKQGYLEPNQKQSGVLTWSRQGVKTGSISILVDTCARPYLELDYTCNDTPKKYRVYFDQLPSNLGKGFVWYFICPQTGKRCRKLYLAASYFYHRSAFRGCMYETQTQSKKWREWDKTLGAYFKSDNLYSELYKKNFKKTYAGKPTKKYLRIMEQIRKVERIPYHEIERAMLS